MENKRFFTAKGNTEWQQWSEAEKEDIASVMERYGIGWHKRGDS